MVSLTDMAIERARTLNYPLGVHRSPAKAKGGFGRFTAHNGLSRGIRSDRMVTYYKPGMSPKEKMIDKVKIYSLIHFTFKGEERAGILMGYNSTTFTVQIVNETVKKAIKYDKFIKTTDQIIIPIAPVKPKAMGKARNNEAKENFLMLHKLYGTASFTFKGKETLGIITSVNEHTFTVKIAGIKNKKAIRFDKFIELV